MPIRRNSSRFGNWLQPTDIPVYSSEMTARVHEMSGHGGTAGTVAMQTCAESRLSLLVPSMSQMPVRTPLSGSKRDKLEMVMW